MIVTVEEVANPLPATVTEVPSGPLEGVGVTDGDVTTNGALAVLELASVAMIVCEPAGEPVSTNEQLKEPEPLVLHVEGDVI